MSAPEEVGPFITVHEVRAAAFADEDPSYEYQCVFCGRAGIGYLERDSAKRDARKHRCMYPAWNESVRPGLKTATT